MLQGDSNFTAHIDPVELARLLEESRLPEQSVPATADVHPHLASCSSCRQEFEQLLTLERQLETFWVNSALPSNRADDCPGPRVWRDLAGGLEPAEQTLSLIKHASQCDHCGPQFRAALAESINLAGEPNDEEKARIASLESASPVWQQQLAKRIAGLKDPSYNLYSTPRPSWGQSSWWQKWFGVPRLAMAGASLLVVLGVGSWLAFDPPLYQSIFRRDQPAAARELLARAYTEKRTLELRFPGAAYGQQRNSRGPATSFADRPTSLSKAEALIATQLESHPSDPLWLQAKGEADLLDGRYDPAVDTLRRAVELDPNSLAILIDLGTAYSQRALQEGRDEDFAAAYEHLSQALRLGPDDPVALFNRAIVAEHQYLYHQALEDWEHYLRLDPSSQWADEVRIRAEAVRARLREHQSQVKPLLTPAEITGSLSDADPAAKVDPRIEEYLEQAVLSWLPQAFPEATAPPARAAADPSPAQALFFLAELTSRHHRDQWLSDLLRGSSASNFPQAIAALARAVKANKVGDYDVSRQQATLAEQLFRASGNTAGVLHAEFEQSIADQVSRRSEDCRRRAVAAGVESRRYSYPWVKSQLGLEEGVCSAMTGDLGNYERATLRAQGRAQQAGYGSLYLRALGFGSEAKFDMGDRASGWNLVFMGLEHYWSGQFPAMSGYSLYSFEADAAEANQANQANLQLAAWREAASVIDAGENLPLRGEAHSNMARAADAAFQPEVAEHQYTEAIRLYALAPASEAASIHRLENEILIAQLESRQGSFEAALARLTRVQDGVRQLSNSRVAQVFYSSLGEVQLRRMHAVEAEQAFRAALGLAEPRLASLTSESDRLSWSESAAPVYRGLAEAELVQGREQESLDVFERYLGAPQRVGMPDPASPRPRPSALSQQTVLAYGLLPDGLAIWVYDDRGVSAKWIPQAPQQLQDLAADFHALCSNPGSELSALRRESRILYSLLIAPVEQQLDSKRTLVIETEGFLAQVPFEALLDSRGLYLVERVPMVHSLGQESESRLRNDAPISSGSAALAVGSSASSPADGLVPIPDVAVEADDVASLFPSAQVLKGREVTLGAIRKELPGVAVFHFAGHALAAPGRTGLLVGIGQGGAPGLMDAAIVRQLHLQNLQLAVLSACSTASGSGGSSGFDSVTDALLRAGVPHVVASRWTVDSAETQSFVLEFYRNALTGQAVSDAIRLTSRKMLANPRTSHPYYWTAFAAYGRS